MPNPQSADTAPFDPATLLYKRGYHYVQGGAPLAKGKPTLVGPVFALRYVPARPDPDRAGLKGVKAWRKAQQV